jgi:hypothetical protein
MRYLMAEKLDEKEVVSFKELLMSQMIQLDAVSELMIEKGGITKDEFEAKLKQVQFEYESREAVKG